MYWIEFIFGVLGNLVVVLGYLLWLRNWKSINVYFFNLAVSDLVFLCTLPRLAYNYAQHLNIDETSPYICLSNRFILHTNLYSSLLFMVWVSVDRYLLLLNPQRQHILLKCSTAIMVSASSWLLITIQVAPLLTFIYADLQTSNWTECRDFGSLSAYKTSEHLAYSLVLTVTGYIFPLSIMCFSTYKMIRFLRAQEQVFSTRSVSFHRPICVAGAAALMFILLYCPYHVMRNVYIGVGMTELDACIHDHIKSLYILTRPVAFAHSVINPIFYFLMGDKFKELLLNRVRGLCPSQPSEQRVSA